MRATAASWICCLVERGIVLFVSESSRWSGRACFCRPTRAGFVGPWTTGCKGFIRKPSRDSAVVAQEMWWYDASFLLEEAETWHECVSYISVRKNMFTFVTVHQCSSFQVMRCTYHAWPWATSQQRFLVRRSCCLYASPLDLHVVQNAIKNISCHIDNTNLHLENYFLLPWCRYSRVCILLSTIL